MYTADRMTPVAATAASSGRQRYAPISVRNSPMNPFRPGIAIDDSVMIRNAATSFGVTCFRPPYSAIWRVCLRSDSMPTIMNRRAGADAVVQHLVDGALHALHVRRADAQDDEAHVAHRGVGHQLLHVRLHHRDERAVDDADDRQRADVGSHLQRGVGEQREREPDQPVGAHLQQDAGQDHRAGRRRLHVRVRQPRVEREQRHLDREREREGQEEPELRLRVERELVQLQQVEAVLAGGLRSG